MALAWNCPLPEPLLNTLNTGDLLLFQCYDSISSWLIMYGTQSHVSHIGIFVKPGKVLHALPKTGSKLENLQNMYSNSTLILPLHLPEEIKATEAELDARYTGIPYGYYDIISKAVKIFTARLTPFFQWPLFFDFAILLFLIDALLYQSTGYWGCTALIPVHFAVIIFNIFRWQKRPLDLFASENGAPCMGLLLAKALGGHPLYDPRHMKMPNQKANQ